MIALPAGAKVWLVAGATDMRKGFDGHASVRKLSKKAPLALAIGYSLSRWSALTRYCDDGRVEIDNNAAERALRAVILPKTR